MSSPTRVITDIKNSQNQLKTKRLLSAATYDGIPAYSNDVEVHGTWQPTGLPAIDPVTGTSRFNGQRLRFGTNVTSYAVKDSGSPNGVVATLEVSSVSPSWKADLYQSLIVNIDMLILVRDNYELFAQKLASSFDSSNVADIISAMYGVADGNASLIPN